jgi:hypothetical protein
MVGVPMLWGGGSSKDKQDATRLSAFKAITTSPKYIMGFEEPDCSTEGSSSMSVDKGKSLDLSTETDDQLLPPGPSSSHLTVLKAHC